MNRAKIRHIIAAIYAVTVLLVGTVFMPTASAEDKEYTPPKLVWERTFEKNILAVGVDDERFARTNRDIATCLKWILFKGWQLRWLGRSGVVMRIPVRGQVLRFWVSSSGRYFVAWHNVGNFPRRRWWKPWEGTYYRLYGWNGRNRWVTKGESIFPWFVWNDGSSVFVERAWDPDDLLATGLKFFDAWGRVAGTYKFPEPRVFRRYSSVNTSSNLLAVGLIARSEEGVPQEIYVFRRDGQLVWKKEDLKRWDTHPRFGKMRRLLRELTVSDRGDVFALFACYAPPVGYEVLIYDEEGNPRDSLSLRPSGGAVLVRIQGNLVFLTTRACDVEGRRGWSRFLCYDLESMRTRFLLTEEHDYHFGSFDVDEETGLIAVAVHDEKRGRDAIRIYDLWGTHETVIRVDIARRDDSWFKLLDGALLVAEKNKLRLYEIDVELTRAKLQSTNY